MKILAANGANIPALGLGTFRLQGEECTSIVLKALAAGYRHIDTAAFYENESEIGAALRQSKISRDEIFLTTKVWPSEVADGAFQRSVEGSLQRLGLDQVDLLLIHWPPKNSNVKQWARLLCDTVRNGWTRHIGISNFTTGQIDAMVDACDYPIVVNQVENHPYIDQTKIRAKCAEHGMAIMGYCPLGRGQMLLSDSVIAGLAAEYDKSPAQIILRWHVQHEGAGAIPKTASPDRLVENLQVFDFELSAGDMAAMEALTKRHQRLCDYDFSPQWDQP
ncbi:MAG: aldo/keto reductase [Rhizobiaceae bacterium]|nr:aldo/keto reductase [Rhizobiaceae bacterium]